MVADENEGSAAGAKAAYALVDASVIAQMSGDDDILSAINYSIPLGSSSQKTASRGPTPAIEDNTVQLTTLAQWYNFYAARYPSRGYLEQQDYLLQLEQEEERQNEIMDREKRKRQGGWLRRLFFGSGDGNNDEVTEHSEKRDQHNEHDSIHADSIHENYGEDNIHTDSNHDDGLCGTTSSIDTDAITREAVSFHRFHLVSERRALCAKDTRTHNNQWHVAIPIRNSAGVDSFDNDDESRQRSTYCIVGYGKIAEFPSLPSPVNNGQLLNGEAKVTLTSDRAALCQFVDEKSHDSLNDLRHTRAALIGPDCLAVSWGRADGFIVIYRRAQQQSGANRGKRKEEALEVGWMAVAVIAPTDAVVNEGVKNMSPSPYIAGDDEQQVISLLFESGPLRVTDLMPVVLQNNNNVNRDDSMSAILAISRLGGYIEFVPIPNQIWSQYARPPTPPLNQLPNLTGLVQVSAISTGHRHIDIMALDAHQILRVTDSKLEENQDERVSSVAEIILASSGRAGDPEASHYEQEVVTLWGITTDRIQPKEDERDDYDSEFSVRVNEITSIAIGQLGADSTVFCPRMACDYWVKDGSIVQIVQMSKQQTQKKTPCCITAKVPFTSLRFSPKKSDVFLAALDYNGGITVIDTTNSLSFSELGSNNVESECDPPTPLLNIVSRRESSFSSPTEKSCGIQITSQIEWWCPPQSAATYLTSISTSKRKRTQNKKASFESMIQLRNVERGVGISGNSRIIPIRNQIHPTMPPKGGTLLLSTTYHSFTETLQFLQYSEQKQNLGLSISGVRRIVDPSQMITFLLERSDPEKALLIARDFGGAEHFGGSVMNECRIKLWEDQTDVEALRLISDDKYVINEAVNLIEGESGDDTWGNVQVDTLREVFREGLRRCGKGSHVEVNIDDDLLPTNTWKLRNAILSVGTFKLLLKHFMKGSVQDDEVPSSRRFFHFHRVPVFEIAKCAAASCDIGALTIIFARHRLSLRERMLILDQIPFTLNLALFHHLLPCHHDGESVEGGFLHSSRSQVFMKSLDFFSHAADAQLQRHETFCEDVIDVFTDENDKENILESLGFVSEVSGDESRSVSNDEIAEWYLKRALNVHKETGQLAHLTSACEMGLIRLGLASMDRDGEYNAFDVSLQALSKESGKLYYIYVATLQLGHISEDKLLELLRSSDGLAKTMSDAKYLFRTLPQFCSMGIAIAFLYMTQSDNVFSRSMFDEHVKSYVASDQYLKSEFESGSSAALNADVFSHNVERDVLKVCIGSITSVRQNSFKCRKWDNVNCESLSASCQLNNVLTSCVAFASLNHLIPSAIHNIQADKDLVDFVNNVLRSTILVANNDWDLITDSVMLTIWSLFELLPLDGFLSVEKEQIQMKGNEDMSVMVRLLYFKQVVLQMFCKWRLNDALPCKLKVFLLSGAGRDDTAVSNDEKEQISSVGRDMVAFVCDSFSDQVVQCCDENLLFDFISDIEELDCCFFSGSIQSSGYLGRLLVPALLKRHAFDALQEILKLQRKWFDKDSARNVIQSFVEEQISSDLSINGREDDTVGLACIKSLGPLFPNLGDIFEHQHRRFDAKNFVSDTMAVNDDIINKVFDMRYTNVNMIECLIQEYPQSLLLRCEFWGDIEISKKACADAVKYFSSQIDDATSGENSNSDSSLVLPPMPGGLLMQFANILGLNSPFNTLLVKKTMLMGALRMKLVHAATAVCYSMLADAAFAGDYADSHKSELVECIDAVLLDQTLNTSSIKKGLCIESFKIIPITSPLSFNTILETFYNLEYESIMIEEEVAPEGANGAAHDSNFLELVAKQARDLTATNEQTKTSFARKGSNVFSNGNLSSILLEIKEKTTTDLLPMLSSFHKGATSKASNLEVISRTVLSWVISEATTNQQSEVGTSLSRYNIIAMIDLAFCCLRELDVDISCAIVDHFVEAFESTLRQESSATQIILPDQAIVQRLNGRGYGWNASRRAAIMTNNQGYSEALSWAVSHFQDDNFDSPLFFLQDEGTPERIEKCLVESIQKLLVAMQATLHQTSTINRRPSLTGLDLDADGDASCDNDGTNDTAMNNAQTAVQSTNAINSLGETENDHNGTLKEKTLAQVQAPFLTADTTHHNMTSGVDMGESSKLNFDGCSNGFSQDNNESDAKMAANSNDPISNLSKTIEDVDMLPTIQDLAPPPPPPPPPPATVTTHPKITNNVVPSESLLSKNNDAQSSIIEQHSVTSNGDSNDVLSLQNNATDAGKAAKTSLSSVEIIAGDFGSIPNLKSSARDVAQPPPLPPPALPLKTTSDTRVEDKSISQGKDTKLESSLSSDLTTSSVGGSLGSSASTKKQVTRGGSALGTHKLSLDERKKL